MLINGNRYKIIGEPRKREFELTNKSIIEAHLNGNTAYEWKRKVTEYYVDVKTYGEKFVRTFVFTEQEFGDLFPIFNQQLNPPTK